MPKVQRVDIWNNDSGVVLSNAGNVFLETGGQARVSWVKKHDYTGLGGTHLNGIAGQVINNAVDTIRGWPGWRLEHVIPLNIDEMTHGEGCDRLFIEWRGEVTAASGFALGGGGLPTDISPTPFYSTGRCHAVGSFVYDTTKSYRQEPPVICYNTAQRGKMASVMSGGNEATTAFASSIGGGFPLTCRSWGHVWDGTADLRAHFPWRSRSVVPFDTPWQSGILSQGALLWGVTARGTGGTAYFPQQGDQRGVIYEVGYEEGGSVVYPGVGNLGTPSSIPTVSAPLRTTGLAHIWLTLFEGAPETKVAPWYLDFDNASMTVKGSITAVMIRD